MEHDASKHLVYLSGEMLPPDQAKISVFDTAVTLGDTVTESTRTFGHRPFKLERHIERLYKSLKVSRINPGMSPDEMTAITLNVLEANLPHVPPQEDVWIVHNISRGMGAAAADPTLQRSPATVIINTAPMILRDWAGFYTDGCHAVTPFSRAIPTQSLDARIKNRSRLAYTLAEAEVKLVDPQAQSVILDTDGNVTENKGGNFFIWADGILKTPHARGALAGISRETVLELAGVLGIPTQVTDFQPYDIYTADEAFFTSTPYCIMPATKFNGLPVGDGAVGPVTLRLLQAWSDLVGLDIIAQAQGHL
ncbi:MAG: branched-chain amino acid aminotransferase [Caldilineaceae bacterium SB0661_bin_32]|uniref:Branched-chain amino acid aminotransferase n=1 Tax=Caldilineaceae bacterium SB0661_bin_32 TaxID=2605255 RepID=A0A6B1D3T2_9CHLR|nr:branched-chain amino acid aminotransferase [Caldilineaceae bacterium SB0661_bin_32]